MSIGRIVVGLLGLSGVAVGVLGLVAFFTDTLVLVASFVPLLVVAALIGTVVLALARQWILALLGVVVVAVGAVTQAPLFVENATSARGPTVRLMQANLMLGQADPTSLVEMVRDRDIDILTVEELTDEAVAGLRAAGLEQVLPEQFLAPFSLGGGTGIYSRFPISNGRNLDGYILGNLVADLDVGVPQPLTLFAVHPIAPFPRASQWGVEMTRLRGHAAEFGDGTVVVSGDFNSTYSHRRFRQFFDDGFTDAADVLGAGLVPTYPMDQIYPPLVAIDHVLTKNASPRSFEAFDIVGSDHRGLICEIVVGR